MRIGEGREEFHAGVAGFVAEGEALRARAQSLRGGAVPDLAFASIFRSLDEIPGLFTPFNLPQWSASQSRRYDDAFSVFTKTKVRVEEELRRLQGIYLAALPSQKTEIVDVPDEASLTPRERAERAFARLRSKEPSSSQNV
mgnify:FL=1